MWKNNLTGQWLEGKVVRISCASFVVQVLNNNKIGEDGWKDVLDNDKVYDDVITASNKCEIPAVNKDAIIRFQVEKPRVHNDCYICMMYDAPPLKAYEIKNIEVKENNNWPGTAVCQVNPASRQKNETGKRTCCCFVYANGLLNL